MHSTHTAGGVRGLLATPGCLCKASVTANNTPACCRGRHRLQPASIPCSATRCCYRLAATPAELLEQVTWAFPLSTVMHLKGTYSHAADLVAVAADTREGGLHGGIGVAVAGVLTEVHLIRPRPAQLVGPICILEVITDAGQGLRLGVGGAATAAAAGGTSVRCRGGRGCWCWPFG